MVVDVGGGIGSTSVVLARAFPHLRFVVQDRQHVVQIAPSVSVLSGLDTARLFDTWCRSGKESRWS